jgi:hypothetical protein
MIKSSNDWVEEQFGDSNLERVLELQTILECYVRGYLSPINFEKQKSLNALSSLVGSDQRL